MRQFLVFVTVLCFIFTVFIVACEKKEQAGTAGTAEQAKMGESLFQQHCSPCHADGGNKVNPQKTLHKKDREANGVKSASDIVSKMRNPGPGMTKFDEKTISDRNAQAIAEYVLKSF